MSRLLTSPASLLLSLQFYLTLNPLKWLDGKKVAFGKVLTSEGLAVLKVVEAVTLNNERPLPEIIISEARVLHLAAEEL